jgi:hypothetical protein
MVRLLSTRVEKKVTTSPDGRLSRSSLEQQSHRPQSSSGLAKIRPGSPAVVEGGDCQTGLAAKNFATT